LVHDANTIRSGVQNISLDDTINVVFVADVREEALVFFVEINDIHTWKMHVRSKFIFKR